MGKITKNKTRPDVCLSLNCGTVAELKAEIEEYREYCQVIEWRVDKTGGVKNYSRTEFIKLLKEIKSICRRKKLIVAFDGNEETGNRLRRWAMGHADIIDIDADNSEVNKMVRQAKRKMTKTIISYHVFDSMPDKDEIATQFVKLEKSGADILKIACFAKSEIDTYEILEAASAYTTLSHHKPIVAIAMGEEGQASRICAGDFGSVMSYACGNKPTQPGQFNAKDLDKYLNIYYKGK